MASTVVSDRIRPSRGSKTDTGGCTNLCTDTQRVRSNVGSDPRCASGLCYGSTSVRSGLRGTYATDSLRSQFAIWRGSWINGPVVPLTIWIHSSLVSGGYIQAYSTAQIMSHLMKKFVKGRGMCVTHVLMAH